MRCAPVEVERVRFGLLPSANRRGLCTSNPLSLPAGDPSEKGMPRKTERERERERDGKADWSHSFRVRHIDVAFARLRMRNAT